LHCIVPGGGITPQGNWKRARSKGKYLFPTHALAKVFRVKYMAELSALGAAIPQQTAKLGMQKQWVVYAKRPFASPRTVVEYLGRYTHKIAISNHRINSIDHNQISFAYMDYKQSGTNKTMTLSANEFLRRFCLHLLPAGFVRMRHCGILASRNKRKELNLAKAYFGMELWEVLKIDGVEIAETKLGVKPNTCKAFGGELEVIAVLHGQHGPPSQRMSANLNYEVQ
jgi:hypothetical protein